MPDIVSEKEEFIRRILSDEVSAEDIDKFNEQLDKQNKDLIQAEKDRAESDRLVKIEKDKYKRIVVLRNSENYITIYINKKINSIEKICETTGSNQSSGTTTYTGGKISVIRKYYEFIDDKLSYILGYLNETEKDTLIDDYNSYYEYELNSRLYNPSKRRVDMVPSKAREKARKDNWEHTITVNVRGGEKDKQVKCLNIKINKDLSNWMDLKINKEGSIQMIGVNEDFGRTGGYLECEYGSVDTQRKLKTYFDVISHEKVDNILGNLNVDAAESFVKKYNDAAKSIYGKRY